MPLNSEHEALARKLDCFDDSVRSSGHNPEWGGERCNCLMMIGIHHKFGRADDTGQKGIGNDGDRVCNLAGWDAEFVLAVVQGIGDFIGQVLVERTTERDIEHLDAATDGEDRQVTLECCTNQSDLEAIASLGYTVRQGMGGCCAVLLGIDVAAASEEKPIQGAEEGFGLIDRWEHDGYASSLPDGLRVIEVEEKSLGWTVGGFLVSEIGGDPDEWSLHETLLSRQTSSGSQWNRFASGSRSLCMILRCKRRWERLWEWTERTGHGTGERGAEGADCCGGWLGAWRGRTGDLEEGRARGTEEAGVVGS
jgi:hypothetical protein